MKKLELSLIESEAKILLEALIEKETVMSEICETSDDEDLIADIGNDLIELRLLLKTVKEQAVSQFGPSVLEFGKEPL
jgi:hypothetical protein